MTPVTAFKPVLLPLSVRVVVLPAVADPVTAPRLSRLVAEVAPAVTVALAALVPEITMAELIVSVWLPLPESVWMTPPLFKCRMPVPRV